MWAHLNRAYWSPAYWPAPSTSTTPTTTRASGSSHRNKRRKLPNDWEEILRQRKEAEVESVKQPVLVASKRDSRSTAAAMAQILRNVDEAIAGYETERNAAAAIQREAMARLKRRRRDEEELIILGLI